MATQRITRATVAAALRNSMAGESQEITDQEVRGLMLRVGPKGSRWSFRVALRGKPKRWDLGNAELHEPDWYRKLAREAHDLCRRHIDPTEHIARGIGLGISPLGVSTEQAPTWTFEQAVEAFLAEKAVTRSTATLDDYRWKLVQEKAWKPLQSHPICQIDDADVQKVLNAIAARGAYTAAEGTYRVVRALFNWCAKPGQRKTSGVAKGLIADVRPPDRPHMTEERHLEQAARQPRLPTVEELGRMMAVVRSRAMPLVLSTCIELILRTAVRRATAAPCSIQQIEEIDPKVLLKIQESGEWFAWVIPPYFMKGRKASHSQPSTLPHLIPISGDMFTNLDRCRRLHRYAGSLFFPAARARRKGQTLKYAHIHPSTISHALLNIPSLDISPHDIRRAFATYGQQILGFSKEEVQIIVDHAEGRDTSILGRHYDYRDHLELKLKIMMAWNRWLDKLADEAIQKDPSLRDRMALRAKIEKLREKKFAVDDKAEDALFAPPDVGALFAQATETAREQGFKPDFSDPEHPKPFQGLIDMLNSKVAALDAATEKERLEKTSRRRNRKPRG